MKKRILLPFCAMVTLFMFCPKVEDVPVPELDFSNLTDGAFEGEDNCKNIVTAKVKVVVRDGAVLNIEVVDHNHGPKYGGEAIVPRLISTQSFQVDDVTGATISGRVIERAVADALRKSKKSKPEGAVVEPQSENDSNTTTE